MYNDTLEKYSILLFALMLIWINHIMSYMKPRHQNRSLTVKAMSDTLKQIGPSTFLNFTRPNKGLIILPPFAPDDIQALAKRTVLLY